ncbi:MAG: PAS domain S-box protein [Desulfobacula sp.]|jgi:diguanylate cyclase (GGDEF)-like protein/PAS domain S-box-containing protein|nr:PAS domain S-box protein [Desulfobacula sp.]
MTEKPTYEELKKKIQTLEQAESNRKRSEKQLIHSHDLMDYIISHARSAIAVFDRDLKYIYVSTRYLTDYKVKEQHVIGKHHYEVFPDLPQKWKDVHQKSLAGEVLSAEEDPYYREDGSVHWTRWECRPWYESDGSIGGIIIYNEVINEWKKIEEAFRKSEQLLSTHLLNTPIGAISWDLNFKTVEWNPAAENIFGYTKKEVIGKHVTELILPEKMKELVESVFQNILSEKGGGVHSINENITKDGRRIICDWYNTALKDVDGRSIGMASLVHDITERKQTEEALKESEERLKTILSATPDPIVIYSSQGETEYLNPAFVEVFGWTLDELRGKRIPFVPDNQKQITSEKIKELLGSGNKVQFETKRLTKRGSNIDVIISASCIKNLNNKISKLIVILKDITDQKQAKQELKLLNFKLEHEATHDPLTGAPNRRAILDRLSEELYRAKRGKLKLSIGLCDIDHFKHVNDKHGHQVGDDVLCSFVKAVQDTLRPYDLVGRYGGEEFLIVIPDLPGSTGLVEERIYERVRARIADHKMVTRSGEVGITISIGITSRSGDETADAMIAKADAALYKAKENGRNQLAFAD